MHPSFHVKLLRERGLLSTAQLFDIAELFGPRHEEALRGVLRAVLQDFSLVTEIKLALQSVCTKLAQLCRDVAPVPDAAPGRGHKNHGHGAAHGRQHAQRPTRTPARLVRPSVAQRAPLTAPRA